MKGAPRYYGSAVEDAADEGGATVVAAYVEMKNGCGC
jgi:hypothetical protein